MSLSTAALLPTLPEEPGTTIALPPAETPVSFEVASKTVVRLAQPLRAPTLHASSEAIAAMGRLVELMHRLQTPGEGWQSSEPPTPAALAPYVSEEVHDVLDALQNPLGLESLTAPFPSVEISPLTTIEALIPLLFWCVARTSFAVMQLVEGVSACCCQSASDPATSTSGVLRLGVLLQAETPTMDWCFDLTTRQPPQHALDRATWIQIGSNSETHSIKQVEEHLQALLVEIEAATPIVTTFFEGVPVELLPPGSGWQSGALRLTLQFEFVPDPAPAATAILSKASPLVQCADADVQSRYTHPSLQRQLACAIAQLQPHVSSGEDFQSEAAVVQTAASAIARIYSPDTASVSLLQPEPLLTGLVPKLLWRLTQISAEVMQLLGGVPAHVLQPGAVWQEGSLRLLPTLMLSPHSEQPFTIDLVTAEPLSAEVPRLHEESVIQTLVAASAHPIQAATLLTQLQRSIEMGAPEFDLLQLGVAVEWLRTESAWQSAQLFLTFDLVFVPFHHSA